MIDIFALPPQKFGVYGDEIFVRAVPLHVDFRPPKDTPGGRLTNAFGVWVGRLIVVVSEGVSVENFGAVAQALRSLVGSADAPIAFSLPRTSDSEFGLASTEPKVEPDVALAYAYVLVQRGLLDRELIDVVADGHRLTFRCEFVPLSTGGFHPQISTAGASP